MTAAKAKQARKMIDEGTPLSEVANVVGVPLHPVPAAAVEAGQAVSTTSADRPGAATGRGRAVVVAERAG